jgi:hypothetical protein
MEPGRAEAAPLAVLQRVRRPAPRPRPGERCDLCSVAIPDEHRHVVELDSRSLKCACQACALLFTAGGAAGGRFRSVPKDVYSLPDLTITSAQWDGLQIPVGVAFFFTNSDTGAMSAFYPSPAGATESLLPLGAFDELADEHPALDEVRSDVEAILVRLEGGMSECFIVPIDVCYELVGLLRQSWRGFDGGKEAHERLDELFGRLARTARPIASGGHRG